MLTQLERRNSTDPYLDETDGFLEGMQRRPRWTTVAAYAIAIASAGAVVMVSILLVGGLAFQAGRIALGFA